MITFLLSLTRQCDTAVLCALPLLGQWLEEAPGALYSGDQATSSICVQSLGRELIVALQQTHSTFELHTSQKNTSVTVQA